MDIIVYNLITARLELSTEAAAIRAGLLMGNHTFSTGSSYSFIFFEEMLLDRNNTIVLKLGILEGEPDFFEPGQKPGDMLRMMRMLWKNRRKKDCLKHYKHMEHLIDTLFKERVTEIVKPMKKFGMVQLASLQDGGDLIVNYADAPKGEGYKDGFRISNMMQLKDIDRQMAGPIAFILFDRSATLPEQDEAGLTHVFRIPNLNALSNDHFLAVRECLRPVMARLQELLQLTPHTGDRPPHLGGNWQHDRMGEVGKAIQEAIDANEDLNWVLSFRPDIAIDVLVGEMETHRFWQHIRDNGLIPDDSWEVLQALPKDGPYPQTIPVIVMRSNQGTGHRERNLSEENRMQHRRKTISLD
ncbi:MAG: hypothetical protein K9J06_08980 [Flavobacteriales bacterium]|nr:hypothetical protein [Flavobacteriales bacterium]